MEPAKAFIRREKRLSEERVRHLEETIAHQGLTIDDLSEEVRRQGVLIDELQRSLRLMADRFAQVEATLPAPEITRPPHY